MTDQSRHKFDEKLDLTYSQYVKDTMAGEVALQKELERVMGKKKAHTLLREWSEKRTLEGLQNYLEKSNTKISNFEEFKAHQEEMWKSPHVSHTHTCETTLSGPDRVTYKVTECIWAKTMKELDAVELGELTMCDIDFKSAHVYHPKIKLIRTKTLMRGDDCCDFTYVWED